MRHRVEARGGVVLQHGRGALLGVDPSAAERPREGEVADRPLARVGAARRGGPGRPVAIGGVEVAVIEIRGLDHVQIAVEDAEAGFAHFALPEWSAMTCATHEVTFAPVGKWRNPFGPWAFDPGPIAPVMRNWASGKRSPSMLMNGIDPPSPANIAGLPK